MPGLCPRAALLRLWGVVGWPSEGGLARGGPLALVFAFGQLTHVASSGYTSPQCWFPSCSSWAYLFQLSLQSCSLSLSSILAQDLPAPFCSPGGPHWPPRMPSLTNPQVLPPSGDVTPSCSLRLRTVEKGDGAPQGRDPESPSEQPCQALQVRSGEKSEAPRGRVT